ncbi:hypothetical protein BU26DRAFT_418752 [Trematosphaeria pertusa]|uniref:DUF3712 domain-containing protein n=1 Tax=Trematosphaeria pertusa TaxID=390896 RepID=A0A6A6ITJ6_9PLEO|nr:uncharacterized protein BU26DRAFT_418752 [Trematosphaeria pertusa]KAF2253182.1 hypothetical protein BU26DRAFT_418752 [Trematosphaeria pertusa]
MDKIDHPELQEEVNGHGAAAPKKGGVFNTLYPPGPKGGAGPRMKNHCRKFWWCDLLLIAAITLIIVLPIIYVAIPKKAQHDLDASTLDVTEQDVTSPTTDGVHLKLVSVAKSGSSFHPTIEGFQAGLSLLDQPAFIYINVPETKAEAETTITVDQDVAIANMDAFKDYNKVVMGSESFDVYMDGKTKIHQSGLQAISVNYHKKVTMKGLNKLAGLNITNIRILSGSDEILPDGSNMVGNVIIPNPSVMTIDLGNVTMNLAVDGTAIGTSLLPNLVLKPGENNVSMQSTVEQLQVIGLIQTKYQNAVIPLEIVGNSSMKGDEHLEYYEAAIQSNTIKLDLNIGPALQAIGINTTDFA